MGEKWMNRAVKRPGALRRMARAAGMTTLEFARKNAHDSGSRGSRKARVGEEARFALIAQDEQIPPKEKKEKRHAPLPRAAAG